MGTKFDRNRLAVKRNNYETKIVNVYIVYDLDICPKNSTNSFWFKNCLFGATSIVKNSEKEKWALSIYGITFDGAGSWNFGNGFARIVAVFGVGNSLSFHADDFKNIFLVLGKDSTYGIIGSFGSS